jgi:hypothetical protein
MNLKEAYEQLSTGKSVRRQSWLELIHLKYDDNGLVKCFGQQAVEFQYDLSIINSSGWVVVGDEEGEVYIFPDAITHFLSNKKIKLKDWPKGCHLEIENGKVFMRKMTEYPFVPTFECLMANDWDVVND